MWDKIANEKPNAELQQNYINYNNLKIILEGVRSNSDIAVAQEQSR